MTTHRAVGEGRSRKLGSPITDWSSDEICESAKRRNWTKGLSLKFDDRDGGVVLDAVAFDVSLEAFVSQRPLEESSDGTGDIFASVQINVAEKAALAG